LLAPGRKRWPIVLGRGGSERSNDGDGNRYYAGGSCVRESEAETLEETGGRAGFGEKQSRRGIYSIDRIAFRC